MNSGLRIGGRGALDELGGLSNKQGEFDKFIEAKARVTS
jgi:hypothetical protein